MFRARSSRLKPLVLCGAFLFIFFSTACGSDTEPSAESPAEDASPEPEESPAGSIPVVEPLLAPSEDVIAQLLAGSKEVRFEGGKGDVLEGRLFGDGDIGLVLAHGYSPEGGQYDWLPVAAALAPEGYSVLTFNFTGFCPEAHGLTGVGCSKGKESPSETWRDIEPAVTFLKKSGASDVLVIGSSMGGMAALYSASQTEVEIAGIVTMGSPREAPPEFPSNMNLTDEIVTGVEEPKLFMAGDTDGTTGAEAEAMFDIASEPKELGLLESPAHGSDLLVRSTAEVSEETMSILIGFLRAQES